MARYIDADLLIEELRELQKLSSPSMSKVANEAIDLGLSLAMRTVRKAPTADVVEVVRCEDCQHKEQCPESLIIEGKDKYLVFCSCGAKMDE